MKLGLEFKFCGFQIIALEHSFFIFFIEPEVLCFIFFLFTDFSSIFLLLFYHLLNKFHFLKDSSQKPPLIYEHVQILSSYFVILKPLFECFPFQALTHFLKATFPRQSADKRTNVTLLRTPLGERLVMAGIYIIIQNCNVVINYI